MDDDNFNATVQLLDGKLHDGARNSLKMANFLGYNTVEAAICVIDAISSDKRVSYLQLMQRTRALESEIAQERVELKAERESSAATKQSNEELLGRTRDLEAQLLAARESMEALRVELQTEKDSRSSLNLTHRSTQKELRDLQRRYDDLVATKQKADERYVKDQRKLHTLMLYVKSGEYKALYDEYQSSSSAMSSEERKQKSRALDVMLTTKLEEIGIEFPPNFSKLAENKENERTPTAETRSTPKRRSQSSPRALEKSSVANTSRPIAKDHSGVILVPNSSDVEFSPERHYDTDPAEQPLPLPALVPQDADVSRTESDYSQDPFPLINPELPAISKPASDPERIVQPTPPVSTERKPKIEPIEPVSSVKPQSRSRSSADDEPPRKQRRVSSPGPSDRSKRRISGGIPGSAESPLYVSGGDTPPAKPTSSRSKKPTSKRYDTPKSELRTPIVNARASSSKQPIDYSAYKGHGRYARKDGPENQTINARFGINPARNGGMDQEYDEVVRGADKRRKLHGEDCECCRGYYENVGPMPNRLQPPLWRSPPKDPPPPPTREEQIAAHKQSVSRHRSDWKRAKTPPGYWTIGFPNTQQVETINERAREMQQEKEQMVEQEAARENGRYYRKG
ncbi:SAE2 domain-containing protein [Mycena chlorophos]|uniref:SAE2 domain-containing protein n=1 Tax=Mycena chlorophos TaxID=658473 RepID=A0A8H6STT6_MYCCL|nr:SAE2 domain-containing protein [Mycena chlorophos]